MKNDGLEITRRWLGRLSFSFLVIGFFLAWEAYRRASDAGGAVIDARTIFYGIGAAASIMLGLTGVRERHRR